MTRDFSFHHSTAPLRGFTLLETLISLGILSSVAAIGFGVGIDNYEREEARFDGASILWEVLQARAEAMNGICTENTCTSGISQSVSIGNSHQVTFAALSGLVANPQNILLGTSSSISEVSITSEGQVSLTP